MFRGTENLGIPFRTLPRKRKQLGIPFRGTKIEAKFHNSVPKPSAEENRTRNSVPWNQNRCKFSEFRSAEENILGIPFRATKNINSRNAVPNHSVEEKPTQCVLNVCAVGQVQVYVATYIIIYIFAIIACFAENKRYYYYY